MGLTGEHLIERARLEYVENVKKYKKELQEKDDEIAKLKSQLAAMQKHK